MHPTLAKVSRTVHWISSALGLASLLFFSVTGITLNHPQWFSATPAEQSEQVVMSAQWLQAFEQADEIAQLDYLAKELDERWGLGLPSNIDSDEFEWVLDYQRPGGLSTVVLALDSGTLSLEQVNDGLVAVINDLHKGRHSGLVWFYLIDITAIICIAFSITGLLLLYVHASKRRSTWPLVTLGTVLPLLLYWIFVP
ncbi:MAG: PepSY-associated TM helix domain-containing protein [Halioglobus sp.]|nr:PepSY-associated TM helix domain-containing protein [Halioglobus sp.]